MSPSLLVLRPGVFLVLALGLLVLPTSWASEKKAAAKPAAAKGKAAGKGEKVEVPKFEMPAFGEIPKTEGLKAREEQKVSDQPSVKVTEVTYSVMEVQHARGYNRTANGFVAVQPLEQLTLAGSPPTLEGFTTRIRVKCPQRASTSIELALLDQRGDTALAGKGQLSFAGSEADEVDYLMEWSPVARPKGGDYQLLIRIAGEPRGTWPIKVVAQNR
jgi:hypothetical protein